ncbi:MAG: diguanylate cyclase [Gammaproteobacteria bacterium]|nr:diguanylate cyclase [Gammaproteobacteria bacterium]
MKFGDAKYRSSELHSGATIKSPKIKWAILAPFLGLIVFVVALFIYIFHLVQKEDLEFEASRTRNSILYLYQNGIENHADILAVSMNAFVDDGRFKDAMTRKDRERLMELTHGQYSKLAKKFGITHWCYIDTNRINVLRMEQPEQFGDKVNSHTLLQSGQSGKPFYGVEVDDRGIFYLRYDYPWRADVNGVSVLIGYIETGIRMDHLFDEIEKILGVDISVVLDKSKLKDGHWLEGLGANAGKAVRAPFRPDVQSLFKRSLGLGLAVEDMVSNESLWEMVSSDTDAEGKKYWVVPVSLDGVKRKDLGYVLAFLDVTDNLTSARNNLTLIVAISIVFGLVIFWLFYRLLAKTELHLLDADRKLRLLATCDGLTGLLNHREIQCKLCEEIERSARYEKHFSLLMIDVDHFKKVNDTYGHQAGDVVLKRISKLVGDQCRAIDWVGRYGGEEIAVGLPETALGEGVLVAERIRRSIENDEFKESGIERIKVTVSVGVSEFPSCDKTSAGLIRCSDQALYQAKNDGRNRVVAADHC